jgi:hypothetical protein
VKLPAEYYSMILSFGLLVYIAKAVAVDEAAVDSNTAVDVDSSTVHVSTSGGPATKLAGLLSLLTPQAAASFQVQGGLRAAPGHGAVAARSVMAEQPDVPWRRSTLPAMTVDSEGPADDVRKSLERLFHSASAPYEQISDAAPTGQVKPPAVEDAVFAAQLGRLARGVALADVRERVHALQGELEAALEREDYATAAALRDEMKPLYAADPSVVADQLRKQLAEMVQLQDFAEAARVRDQMLTLKRFQPQYQLAGLWKGHYPNHGDALVRFTYEGDTLVATKVTGDEHVPAGQVTFRANVAEVDRGDPSDGDARVEVVRIHENTQERMEAERYRGEGCVAAKGYQHAHYIPGQLHLLEDGEDLDVVGFHWMKLGTFVMFSRATEEDGRAAQHAASESFES